MAQKQVTKATVLKAQEVMPPPVQATPPSQLEMMRDVEVGLRYEFKDRLVARQLDKIPRAHLMVMGHTAMTRMIITWERIAVDICDLEVHMVNDAHKAPKTEDPNQINPHNPE